MAVGAPPQSPVDLERLDAYLLSDNAPENGMAISDLDGFLTGLVVGPELIMPSEWLPVIWGHEEPKFDDMDETQAILGTIMGRYNEIIHLLDDDPPTLDPIFMISIEKLVIVSDWCAGFLDAVRLRPKAWEPLIYDQKSRMVVEPFFVIGGEPEDFQQFGLQPKPESEAEEMMLARETPELLTDCVFAIRDYWRTPRAPSAQKPTRRDGRNRPSTRRGR